MPIRELPAGAQLDRASYPRNPKPPTLTELPPDTKLDEEPGMIGRAWNSLSDMVTGRGKKAGYPEITSLDEGVDERTKLSLAAGLLTATDPEQQYDIVQEHFPGARMDVDDNGYITAEINGQKYYVNKPGFSVFDATQLAGQSAAYFPAAKAAGVVGPMGRRFLASGAGIGATSAGLDTAAEQFGSEQGVNLNRMVATGALGGAFEAVSPYARKALTRLFSSPKFVTKAGELTDAGVAFATRMGLDVDGIREATKEGGEAFMRWARQSVGEGEINKIGRAVQEGTPPDIAARLSEAREFGVPLTRGEAAQDIRQMAREEAFEHGAYGEGPQKRLTNFRNRQQQALAEGAERVQGRLSAGGPSVRSEVEAGGVIGEGIKTRANEMGGAVTQAYRAAAETDARLSADSIKRLPGTLRKAVFGGDDPFPSDSALMPATNSALRSIDDLAKLKAGDADITEVSLRRLEAERRKLNRLSDAANTKADRAGVLRVKQSLDEWLDNAFDNALFEGDEEALSLLKDARQKRKAFGDLFESRRGDAGVGKVIEKIISNDADGRMTVQYLFGMGKLGQKAESAKIAARLKNILGEDSEHWGTVREMAFLKFLKAAERKNGSSVEFSGARFARAVDDAFKSSPDLMKTLFSNQEIALINRFKRVAVAATTRPNQAQAPSRTPYGMMRILQDMLPFIAKTMAFKGDVVSAAGTMGLVHAGRLVNASRAASATKGYSPPAAGTFADAVAAGVSAQANPTHTSGRSIAGALPERLPRPQKR